MEKPKRKTGYKSSLPKNDDNGQVGNMGARRADAS